MEILKIWFDDKNIFIKTNNGKEASLPLEWFPKLDNANTQQKENYELSPFGIHWEELDEDLSLEGFFKFKKEKITT